MDRKIGEGHAQAWLRAGFKEAAANLLPAFPQQQRVVEEPGLVGNPSTIEVAAERGYDHGEERPTSVLGYELQQPPPAQGRTHEHGRGR